MRSRYSTVPQMVVGMAAADMRCPFLTDKVHLPDAGRHSAQCCDCTRMVPLILSWGFLASKKYVQVGKLMKPLAGIDLASLRLVRPVAAYASCLHRWHGDKSQTRSPRTRRRGHTRHSARSTWTRWSEPDAGPWRGSTPGVSSLRVKGGMFLAPSNMKGQAHTWTRSCSAARPRPVQGRDSPKRTIPTDNTFLEWRPANASMVV